MARNSAYPQLLEAVIRLAHERETATITVTDIVREAGVTRPTFYAAFTDPANAFTHAAAGEITRAFASSPKPQATRQFTEDELAAFFAEVLAYVDGHRSFFQHVSQGPGAHDILKHLIAALSGRIADYSPAGLTLQSGPLPAEITTEAIAAAVAWTTLSWVNESSPRRVQEMADILAGLVLGLSASGGNN